ncbi:hypothetical protein QZQ97_03350 [Serratia sp. root2]|uniref:hypothetical protein n=1 Tax=Serratia sp. root2 TaxID=3059676 RepID=UPI00288E41D3|nr:hypothetical protein [Serratia sp. root2]MDT3249962.1 hypothetical protein [Serratia sp. root2]
MPVPPFISLDSLDRNQFAAFAASVGWRQIEQCHLPAVFQAAALLPALEIHRVKNIKSLQENSG